MRSKYWNRDKASFLRRSGPRPRTKADLHRLTKHCILALAQMDHAQANAIVETIFDAFAYHGIGFRMEPDGPDDYVPPAGVPIYRDGRTVRVVAGGKTRAGGGTP